MHGACGQDKEALKAQCFGALLNAFEDFLAIPLVLRLGCDGEGGQFGGFLLIEHIHGGTRKNHPIVLNDRVLADVALNFSPRAFDQGAVLFKRLDQLQNTTHILVGRLSQALQLFVHNHRANAIMHIDFKQQGAVHSEGQNMASLNTRFAGLHAVLQVKSQVLRSVGRGQLGQQFFCAVQGQLGVNRVVL